jgi:hypothetical protein
MSAMPTNEASRNARNKNEITDSTSLTPDEDHTDNWFNLEEDNESGNEFKVNKSDTDSEEEIKEKKPENDASYKQQAEVKDAPSPKKWPGILAKAVSALVLLGGAYTGYKIYPKPQKPLHNTTLTFNPEVARPNYVTDPRGNNRTFNHRLNLHGSLVSRIFQLASQPAEVIRSVYSNRATLFNVHLPHEGNFVDMQRDLTNLFLVKLQQLMHTNYFATEDRIRGIALVVQSAKTFWKHEKDLDMLKDLNYFASVFALPQRKPQTAATKTKKLDKSNALKQNEVSSFGEVLDT